MNPGPAPLVTIPGRPDRRRRRPAREKIPAVMNDDPAAGAPKGAGQPDPLDDTQRVEVPRYAPTPDPRPDARWAWATTGDPAVPEPVAGPRHAAAPVPRRPCLPPTAPAPRRGARRRRRTVVGTARPRRTGRRHARRAAAAAPASAPSSPSRSCPPCSPRAAPCSCSSGRARSISRRPRRRSAAASRRAPSCPVTIDESSAVIDAAAKVGPAVVKIDTVGSGSDPFQQATHGRRLGRDLRRERLDPHQPPRDRRRQQAHGRAQGRPLVPGPRLRHRHPHRPRDRQDRPDRPAGGPDRPLRRPQGRPAGRSPSAAPSACTRSR